jgi:hypothetical protein
MIFKDEWEWWEDVWNMIKDIIQDVWGWVKKVEKSIYNIGILMCVYKW